MINLEMNAALEATLRNLAEREGVPPETLVLRTLWEKYGKLLPPIEPRDDWERLLLSIGSDAGVSPPHEAMSSDELYD